MDYLDLPSLSALDRRDWAMLIGACLLGLGVSVFCSGIFGSITLFGWRTPHRLGDRMANCRIHITEWEAGQGYVKADGERWRARGPQELAPGDEVTVKRMHGLLLHVQRKTK